MTTKDWDVALVMREVRRMRAEARTLSVAEIRKTLEDAADRLEKIAQRLARESATAAKAN